MTSLSNLSPYTDDQRVRVVVETPRGSALKFEYDPEIEAITVSRQLAIGLRYPYDWGFVPGTRAADGDPVDAMVIHSMDTHPGVVLPCRLLGMVAIRQRDKGKDWITNNRLIATPAWEGALLGPERVTRVSGSLRKELEQFFLDTAFFTTKHLRLEGWKGPRAAREVIDKSRTQ